MPLIEWKALYRLNIKEIDNQHQMLIEILNELYDAMMSHQARETIEGILKSMADYAGVHFSYEENLMKRHNFPEFVHHKKEHDDFKIKVSDFMEKYTGGSLILSIEVMKFLKDWIKNHIQGSDKKYAPFLNEKGVY
ncbi:MAG: bacteriohemerythrin [Candidatus Omnitrophota bacterium]